ncbi:F-box/FBD/LRR-repeat protein At1g78750 [Lactuca sativa]|uniref:F-box domain-containing protein n=1 Tax=Lactuca sativa TaxID=4236 RepID=A0A9R1UYJ9_LACSA|nr:F-box/FBD/LRR-repeat protein At1g78750 [Lactuca sativa]KAJ0195071.1 hypothetical protein LSAT_V11C700347200 [Lactuca sativa]
MKKSKLAKKSEGELDGVDMISNLPDHILHLILSRLEGTQQSIRSSILSRRWRYLWTSVPSIDISYVRRLDHLPEWDSNRFREFVYWLFLNKPQHLESFRLWCANINSMLTIRHWIHAAVMRKVKLLDLMFCPIDESEDIRVPHSLVTCGSLEVLKLCLLGCRLCLPNITGFQALRVLELTQVDLFGDDLLKYFLEGCPLLEDLSLRDCSAYSLVISSPKLKNLRIDNREEVTDEDLDLDWKMCLSLTISCPKLVYLKLTGYVAMKFLFDSLYSLKKAVIHAQDLFRFEESTDDLFRNMSKVESLSISLLCVEQYYWSDEDEPISLPNLKTLELKVDALHMLIPFLKCLPDLVSLHLIFPKNVYGLDMWNQDEASAATMSILTRHLKKVEFLEFDEEKPKLDLARALLEHGNELEGMVFSWGDETRFHKRSMKTMNRVSKFYKASSVVKLRSVIKVE